MIDAGEFPTDGKYNAHHLKNNEAITNLFSKAEMLEKRQFGYIYRDIFHCVQPPTGFRSQVIHFGNSYKESTVDFPKFIDDWLNDFEKVLNSLIAFYAVAHLDTELG